MYYIDTSILFVYTLGKNKEKERYKYVLNLFDNINSGKYKACVSFYALHEIFIIAFQNAPNFELGAQYAKEALLEILKTKIYVLPLLDREERIIHAQKFSDLRDSSDIPHAISAYVYEANAIIAYDDHFKDISAIIPYMNPEDIK
ncbi:MAG: PIN domain-containing protein [Candidatus Methanofastidiosia archaeon]|jgi:predicted nucleic acid-binding protein